MSKGEEKIKKILKENKVNFKVEVSFPGLFGFKGAPLRFDFVIFDSQGKVWYIIEYDGEEHFKQINYFSKTKQDFLYRQEMDRRKNRYAIVNNIKLIRIPFWDLEKISYESIFNKKEYIVTSIYHNDIINPYRE